MKSSRAFTLIEIMTVIGIIGIIIAIAVPAFMRARERSRFISCAENRYKVDQAKAQFAMDSKLTQNDTVNMDDLVQPNGTGYLKRVPTCPGDNTPYTLNTVGTQTTCDYVSGFLGGSVNHVDAGETSGTETLPTT